MQTPLLLLHGALGSATQMQPLASHLTPGLVVHTLDFEGHGGVGSNRPFRIEHFIRNVIDYLEREHLPAADVFGFSMGGYVACSLARNHPTRVRRIATLGTIFRWTPEIATRESRFLDPARIREKVPRFADALESRHSASGWVEVVERTKEMLHVLGASGGIGAQEMAALSCPLRILIGDGDETADAAHSEQLAAAAPAGSFEVLPETPHAIEKAPLERLARSLLDCFRA